MITLRLAAYNDPKKYKRLQLSPIERRIVKWALEQEAFKATELASEFGYTPEHASVRLKRLYEAGYMRREPQQCGEQGAIHYYVYTCRTEDWTDTSDPA